VVYVNEDSRYSGRLLDSATLAPIPLTGMPTGTVRGISLSRDDSAIAFYSSDGSAPDDLYAARLRRVSGA
jgi:hypothetical protein